MLRLPDLSTHTGTSTSLRVALGLHSLLGIHTTQLAHCIASNGTPHSTTDAVETPSLRRLGLLIDLLSTASTEEHMVLLTILLERVLCSSEGLLSKVGWQPLMLCCFLLTSKELDDDPVSFRDLRMLAVMHDVRSAALDGCPATKHGDSFSSCYNEDIEDIELALLQLLQWTTFCSFNAFEDYQQRIIDNSIEVMAEPNDGAPGSSVLCQADWEYMHERLRACTPPAVAEPVRSSPVLECSMLEAVEALLEDFSTDCEECVPALVSDEEEAQAFIETALVSDEEEAQALIETGEAFQRLPLKLPPSSNERRSPPPPSQTNEVSTLRSFSVGEDLPTVRSFSAGDLLRWQPEMPKWFVAIGAALQDILPHNDAELPGRPSAPARPTCPGGANGLVSPQSWCDADWSGPGSRPWQVNVSV